MGIFIQIISRIILLGQHLYELTDSVCCLTSNEHFFQLHVYHGDNTWPFNGMINCDSAYWINGLQIFCFLIGHIVWTMRQPFYVFMLVKEARDTILAIFFGFSGTGIESLIYQTQTGTLLATPPSRFPWHCNLPLCDSKGIGQSIITYGATVITIVYIDICYSHFQSIFIL